MVWGGERLKERYGKQTDASHLAETWELSLHKAGESTLSGGRLLSEVATSADFGENCKNFSYVGTFNSSLCKYYNIVYFAFAKNDQPR